MTYERALEIAKEVNKGRPAPYVKPCLKKQYKKYKGEQYFRWVMWYGEKNPHFYPCNWANNKITNERVITLLKKRDDWEVLDFQAALEDLKKKHPNGSRMNFMDVIDFNKVPRIVDV